MKLGFTGTRDETTVEQHRSLIAWFTANVPTEFHHGCCVGADEDAAFVVAHVNANTGTKTKRVGHPPTNRSLMSSHKEMIAEEFREPLPYLVRNRVIVDETAAMLACPKGPEELRSGTWSTVRYARRLKRPITIIWPDGEVTTENQQ